jgi:hypothetical protein
MKSQNMPVWLRNMVFGPQQTHLDSLLKLAKGATQAVHLLACARKECNKYDLTTTPCF